MIPIVHQRHRLFAAVFVSLLVGWAASAAPPKVLPILADDTGCADIGERRNLATEHPAKLAEWKKLAEAWSHEVDTDCHQFGREPKFTRPVAPTKGKK